MADARFVVTVKEASEPAGWHVFVGEGPTDDDMDEVGEYDVRDLDEVASLLKRVFAEAVPAWLDPDG